MANTLVSAVTAASIIAGFGGGYAIAALSGASGNFQDAFGVGEATRDGAGLSDTAAPSENIGETGDTVVQRAETRATGAAGTTVADTGGSDPDGQLAWNDDRVVFLGRVTVPIERPFDTSYVVTDIALAMPTPEEALALKSLDKSLRLRDAAIIEVKSAATSRMLREDPHNLEILSSRLKAALEGDAGAIDEILLLTYHVSQVPRT